MGLFDRTKRKTRSPLPNGSLPQAGESLNDLYHNRRWDIVYWAVVIVSVGLLCSQEWIHYWLKSPPSPFIGTLLFFAAIAIGGYRIQKILRELPDLRLGTEGERIVGERLETLRSQEYRIFHDIIEDDYNIDHVIIGPEGVFAIETKTRSKPARGNATVTYDGRRVLVGGMAPDRDPIVQAKAAARRVRAILKEQCGVEVWVNPVVLYPGWYVSSINDPELTVANENYFVKGLQIRAGDQISTHGEIELLAEGMDRYLRQKP
jgi:hypothetical protein